MNRLRNSIRRWWSCHKTAQVLRSLDQRTLEDIGLGEWEQRLEILPGLALVLPPKWMPEESDADIRRDSSSPATGDVRVADTAYLRVNTRAIA